MNRKGQARWVSRSDVRRQIQCIHRLFEMAARASGQASEQDRARIGHNVGLVFRTFHSDEGIGCQELDGIENPELYTEAVALSLAGHRSKMPMSPISSSSRGATAGLPHAFVASC